MVSFEKLEQEKESTVKEKYELKYRKENQI